jgi:hypothetical protein
MSKETVTTADTVEETTKTHEYVIIDGTSYQTESVSTGTDSISFALNGLEIAAAVEKFKPVTALSVSGEDLKPYGVYSNLTFTSAAVDADGLVTVVFHIATKEEVRIKKLESTQAEQDIAISELMFGGESNE